MDYVKFLRIFFLISILLGLVLLLTHKSWVPKIVHTILRYENIQSISSEWQTYKNEDFKFAFKYPRDWQVIERKLSKTANAVEVYLVPSNNTQSDISFFVGDSVKRETYDATKCPVQTNNIECNTVENIYGVQYVRQVSAVRPRKSSQQQLDAFFINNDLLIQMSTVLTDIDGKPLENTINTLPVFEKIITTFEAS
ncbi:MAG: hypothetical protein AAB510_01740 [Patescibacteria group bacterium]